jgi:hypothetical protein
MQQERQNSQQHTSDNCGEWRQTNRGTVAARLSGGRVCVFLLSLIWLVFSTKTNTNAFKNNWFTG